MKTRGVGDMTTKERVFEFLDGIRKAGITNTPGAGPYIQKKIKAEFGIDGEYAKKLIMEWMIKRK